MEAAKPSLHLLAETEAAILVLERERARIPQAIAEAEARAAAAAEAAKGAREQLETAEKQRRTQEAAAQDLTVKRDKLHGQSAVVKTNKEYTTLLAEIEAHSKKIGECEDAVLVAMEAIEEASAALKQSEASARAVQQEVKKATDELRAQLAGVESQLAERIGERKTTLAALGPHVENLYAHVIKTKKNGIARIEHGSCSGCHRALPPEVMNRVRAGEVHACGSCHRILLPPGPS
jgi:predicted  nucleic acid-binding Zn-ribbon protein